MINGSIDRELEKRNEDQIYLIAGDLINYILNHMLSPPQTLKTFALDLQAAIAELMKRRGIK